VQQSSIGSAKNGFQFEKRRPLDAEQILRMIAIFQLCRIWLLNSFK